MNEWICVLYKEHYDTKAKQLMVEDGETYEQPGLHVTRMPDTMQGEGYSYALLPRRV